MKEKLYQSLIELTNGKYSSLFLKKVTTSPLSKKLIQTYSKVFQINLSEVSHDIHSYTSLQDFFIRTLKDDARKINTNDKTFISPVDAKVESFGNIENDVAFVVKNKQYSLFDLLGKKEIVNRYENGKYVVLYLSPANYHRIHSPIDATVVRQYTLGNKSYPVNDMGLKYGKKPITHNYRMISELQYNQSKHFALIKVGAMFVNSIELTNISSIWRKGEEIAYFSFGSTVVLLFEKDSVEFTENIVKGHAVKVGEAIATMI